MAPAPISRHRHNHGTLPGDRMENGVSYPRPGSKDLKMWQLIDKVKGKCNDYPERFKVMEAMHEYNAGCTDPGDQFRTQSFSLQYQSHRTFYGIEGDREKTYKKRNANGIIREPKAEKAPKAEKPPALPKGKKGLTAPEPAQCLRANFGTLDGDKESNEIWFPREGTKHREMWDLIAKVKGESNEFPERFKVMEAMYDANETRAESMKFAAQSMSLQYHFCRTFYGIAGDRVKLYMKRTHDASGDEIKQRTEKQQTTKRNNKNINLDKNNMNGETPINLVKLKRLYKNNTAAKKLLDYLAARKKNTPQTKVDTLESELSRDGVTRAQVFETLRELTKLHCGELKIGRKGQVSRMLWKNVKIVSLGQAASGQGNVEDILSDGDEEEIEPQRLSEAELSLMITHSHHLREDLVTEISLPKNLTQREANRLANVIRDLPFGENHSDID